MSKIRYILPILFLSLASCSADGPDIPTPPSGAEQPLQFRSVVGGKGSEQIYEAQYFKQGDQIRVYCPRVYSTPNFGDDAAGMYIYEYSQMKDNAEEEGWENWPYKFQPQGGLGFDWRTLESTNDVYMFEVMHFPGKKYMEEVPDRQDLPYPDPTTADPETSISGLEAADVLIAHRRHPVDSDKSKAVPLTFYHVFAMVEVTVEIPVSETPAGGLFPRDAVREVYMRQMLTHYKANYGQVIDSDMLRTVHAIEGGERKDIYMKKDELTKEEEFYEDEDWAGEPAVYQRFVFRGIVPQQSFLDYGNDFLYFKVKRYDSEEPALYKFKFGTDTESFSLEQAKILSIRLKIDNNANELVVVTAELKPWLNAEGSFDMFPEK